MVNKFIIRLKFFNKPSSKNIEYCKKNNIALNEQQHILYQVFKTFRNHKNWKYFLEKNFNTENQELIEDLYNFIESPTRRVETEKPKEVIHWSYEGDELDIWRPSKDEFTHKIKKTFKFEKKNRKDLFK